jgi:hypothetical protein
VAVSGDSTFVYSQSRANSAARRALSPSDGRGRELDEPLVEVGGSSCALCDSACDEQSGGDGEAEPEDRHGDAPGAPALGRVRMSAATVSLDAVGAQITAMPRARSRLIASPSPAPSAGVVSDRSSWTNGSKISSSLSAGMPGPLVAHDDHHLTVARAARESHLHLAVRRCELRRVAEEVGQNLNELLAIGCDVDLGVTILLRKARDE